MVCLASDRAQCIVRELQGNGKYEVTLAASTEVRCLINQVAESMNYDPSLIKLTLQRSDGDREFTLDTEGTLETEGFNTEHGARNSLLLEIDRLRPCSMSMKACVGCGEESEGAAGTNPNAGAVVPASTFSIHPLQPPPPLLPSSPAGDYSLIPSATSSNINIDSTLKHEASGYVGLVNQAMTCYLNSLLQALYMTPEFRNALYRWKFEPDRVNPSARCFPFELQKLFLKLQTSTRTAVETTELTESFGWDSGEVWQQHDIQELCRVMFDALERVFKETEQADLINKLYQGKMIDYVKCLECETEKCRDDAFLDIPLPVRPFGSTVAFETIEEALKAFVQPETLEGDNQYFCESCNKKCNAHKGLKFSTFPYLLTLHLKRFDFDYSTMHRIKLNDKVSFPERLNLNNLIGCSPAVKDATESNCSTADSVLDEDTCQGSVETQNTEHDQDGDEGIDMSNNGCPVDQEEVKSSRDTEGEMEDGYADGPYVYELYSIMIHSGSATGGHYYAYIKDFAKNEWYCFNDQSVTKITETDIMKTYGGGPTRGYYSGTYSSSTNAYMLMYRQIDVQRNALAMTEEEFPVHIKDLLVEIQQSEKKGKELKARQEEMIRFKVYKSPQISHPIPMHQDCKLSELLSVAHQILKIEVPEEQCRLVTYNRSNGLLENSFDGKDDMPLSQVFRSCRNWSELYLETRDKDQSFTPYSEKDIFVSVFKVNPENETVIGCHNVRTKPDPSLAQFRKFLVSTIPDLEPDLHLVLIKRSPEYLYPENDSEPLKKLGFYSTNRLFLCPATPDDGLILPDFPSSPLCKFIEKISSVVLLDIELPDTSEDELEKLCIPPLSEMPNCNDKETDSTPTGDKSGLPLMTNSVEEENAAGCGLGAAASDQSASEDSSLTDSERTIVGDAQNECQSSPSESGEPANSDPGLEVFDSPQYWYNYYIHLSDVQLTGDSMTKMIRVVLDKHYFVEQLKKQLEPVLGVSSEFFKVFAGKEELKSNFTCFQEECWARLKVTLNRNVNPDECSLNVFLLTPNDRTLSTNLGSWIFDKADTIGNLKRAILRRLEKCHNIVIPFERCRLRRTQYKGLGPVLFDEYTIEQSRCSKTDLVVYEATPSDTSTEPLKPGFLVFWLRRWRPSTYSFDDFQEIVIDHTKNTKKAFYEKISEVSGVPIENLKVANCPFPCEVSVFDVNEMNWSQWDSLGEDEEVRVVPRLPDDAVLVYKDDSESLKELSTREQGEIRNREIPRLLSAKRWVESLKDSTVNFSSSSSGELRRINSSYSPRREKALKIYLNEPVWKNKPAVNADAD